MPDAIYAGFFEMIRASLERQQIPNAVNVAAECALEIRMRTGLKGLDVPPPQNIASIDETRSRD